MAKPEAVEEDGCHELASLLDRELVQLPEKYRVPIVLCDLEGKTRKEAARQLGWPEGIINGRLARGRVLLVKRLARHGHALSSGAIAAVSAQQAASAGVPVGLVASTLEAAIVVAVGSATATGVVSATVVALTEGVLKAMLMSKLEAAVAIGLVLGFMATGATVLTYRTAAAQGDKPTVASDEPKSGPVDPAVALVRQLGDDDFATRETAGGKLRKLGVKARPALEAALRDPDPEIARRSRELLTPIRSDQRAAFAEQFDPKKREEYDHPVWKHFVAIAGDTRASRELFARIAANEKWLRTLDDAEADPAAAGHIYRVGIAEIFHDFERDPARNPVWPCNRGEEVAYLLLLGSHPEENPPAKLVGDEVVPTNLRNTDFLGRGIVCGEGQILHARGLYLGLEGELLDTSKGSYPPAVAGAAGTDRLFVKLLAAWHVRRDPSSEVFERAKALLDAQKPKAEPPAAPKSDPKPDTKPEKSPIPEKQANAAPEEKRVYTPGEVMLVGGKATGKANDGKAKIVTVEFEVRAVTKPTEIESTTEEGPPWVVGHGPDDLSLHPQPPKKFEEGQFAVIPTPTVEKQLDRIGIQDVGKHFVGKTIRISGQVRQQNYSGDEPPIGTHYDLVIDDVSQFEAVD